MTKNLGTLISKLSHETIGVDVSPHLFRTAGASTAAVHGGNHPHLASALLNHRDTRVTEEHYNRATTFSAGDEYALITNSIVSKNLVLENRTATGGQAPYGIARLARGWGEMYSI